MTGKNVVKVYINSVKGVSDDAHRRNMPPFRGRYGMKSQIWDSEEQMRCLNEKEARVIETLKDLEQEFCFELVSFDIEKTLHTVRALKDGVDRMPTVIVNNQFLNGSINREQIVSAPNIKE